MDIVVGRLSSRPGFRQRHILQVAGAGLPGLQRLLCFGADLRDVFTCLAGGDLQQLFHVRGDHFEIAHQSGCGDPSAYCIRFQFSRVHLHRPLRFWGYLNPIAIHGLVRPRVLLIGQTGRHTERRPLMRLSRTMMTATTRRMWMKPPIV